MNQLLPSPRGSPRRQYAPDAAIAAAVRTRSTHEIDSRADALHESLDSAGASLAKGSASRRQSDAGVASRRRSDAGNASSSECQASIASQSSRVRALLVDDDARPLQRPTQFSSQRNRIPLAAASVGSGHRWCRTTEIVTSGSPKRKPPPAPHRAPASRRSGPPRSPPRHPRPPGWAWS